MQNVQYLDPETLAGVPDFFEAYLALLEVDPETDHDSELSAESCAEISALADQVFQRVALSVLNESSKLARALRMPDIGKAISKQTPYTTLPEHIK